MTMPLHVEYKVGEVDAVKASFFSDVKENTITIYMSVREVEHWWVYTCLTRFQAHFMICLTIMSHNLENSIKGYTALSFYLGLLN